MKSIINRKKRELWWFNQFIIHLFIQKNFLINWLNVHNCTKSMDPLLLSRTKHNLPTVMLLQVAKCRQNFLKYFSGHLFMICSYRMLFRQPHAINKSIFTSNVNCSWPLFLSSLDLSWALTNTVMDLRFHKKQGNSFTAWVTIRFSRRAAPWSYAYLSVLLKDLLKKYP